MYTGTRSQALLGLSWLPSTHIGWIDLDNEIIYRRGDDQRKTKKTQTPHTIPRRLLPHLRRWQRADMAVGARYVVHWQGDRIIKLRRSWASTRVAAGLANDVVPHTLASHRRDLAHAARRGLLGGIWLSRYDGRNADDRVWSPPSRLPEGGEGRILTVDGGGPKCVNANGTGRQLTRAASRTFNGWKGVVLVREQCSNLPTPTSFLSNNF